MTPAQVVDAARQAGFTGLGLTTIVAIVGAESGYNPSATHTNSNGSVDRGLAQINSIHTQFDASRLSDPVYNLRAAYQISSGGTNFSPWTTFQTGAWRQHLEEAYQSVSGGASSSVASYLAGQCTAWVASQLTWVPGGLGNARDWARNASRLGYQVSTRPVVGSVAVFAPGVGGASSVGHVAAVVGTNPDGSIRISEMNWLGPYQSDVRTIDAQTSRQLQYILPPVGAGASGSLLDQTWNLNPLDPGGMVGSIGRVATDPSSVSTIPQSLIQWPQNFGFRLAMVVLGLCLIGAALYMLVRPSLADGARKSEGLGKVLSEA